MYSCDFVGRSLIDSGIGLGLLQMMSLRKYQPSARSAKASIHGMPIRSLGLSPSTRGTRVGVRSSSRLLTLNTPSRALPLRSASCLRLFDGASGLYPPPLLYVSPMFTQIVPSSRSTR